MTRFVVPGAPIPWARTGGHGKVRFTPARVRSYEAKVAACAQAAGVEPLSGPIALTIGFYLPRPKRLLRRKDPDRALPCDRRPDLDNLVKAIKDGLGGVAYADDGQVAQVLATKLYHERGGVPRVEIEIRRM